MSITHILHFEALGFLYGMLAIVAYQMLTGRIRLSALLSRKGKTDPNQTNPERIQLLLATIATSASYLSEVRQSTSTNLPDIDNNWLYLMGGSSSLYLLRKAWIAWKETTN
jgi:hypothetical protein